MSESLIHCEFKCFKACFYLIPHQILKHVGKDFQKELILISNLRYVTFVTQAIFAAC